jgi:D-alanyl-D-alanine carboxypeptidase
MGNFYEDVISLDPRFHSTKRCNDMDLLEPVFRAKVEALIKAAAADGLALMVFETYRSQELQEIYYHAGKTQLREVGVHHYGLAADIVKVVDGQPSWEGDFTFLRKYAEDQDLVWGGDWGEPDQPHSFRDMDHVQRITVGDQNALFAGTWYPDDNYDAYS